MNYDLTPIEGCLGCQGTAGRLGCSKHSPNVYISDQPQFLPYVQMNLRCPWCGHDILMNCFKVETVEQHKL
jgi:hypothetical protein